jgi:hypothetical protein
LVAWPWVALCVAPPAQAQTTPSPTPPSTAAPADAHAATAADTTAGEAPAAPATPGHYDDTADTRGDALRAYQKALDARKLAASAPLSLQRLREDLPSIEEKLTSGRRDEAIGDLVYLVESPRFEPFQTSEEGKALLFLLGDALASAGALQPARGYLQRLLKGDPGDS